MPDYYDNHIDQKERELNCELFKQGNAKFQEFFNDDFELLKEIQKELKENSNENAPTTRANSFLNLNKYCGNNLQEFQTSSWSTNRY